MKYKTIPLNSWLFVPATKFDKIAKIKLLNPDVILLDLEDSVFLTDKIAARNQLFKLLKDQNPNCILALRINEITNKYGFEDLYEYLKSDINLDFLFIPKSENQDQLELVYKLLQAYQKQTLIVPIIETAKGITMLQNWKYNKLNDYIYGFMYGGGDMSASLKTKINYVSLDSIKMEIIKTARINDFFVLDTPYFDIFNLEGLKQDTMHTKNMGFDGRTIIHPSHIETVNKTFEYTDAEIELAKKILEENKKGAAKIDGQMIDEAVAKTALNILNKIKHKKNGKP